MPKNVQTTAQMHSSHTLAKKCSKFSKTGFNSTWTVNFQMFKLDLEKAEEPEIKLPTSIGSSKKQESSRKTSTSALLTMPKSLTVWVTTNWKILNEMAGWHHWLNGHEFGLTLGVGDGQGGLACCKSWGRKESDTTERLSLSPLFHVQFKLLLLDLHTDCSEGRSGGVVFP